MTLPTVTELTMPEPDDETGVEAIGWSVETGDGEIAGTEALMLLCE